MNDQQLIAKLKSCKNGMFTIPHRSDVEHVFDLWDENVSRRDRRTLRLSVTTCGTGLVANISPREGLAEQRKEALVVAVVFALAIVALIWLFSVFANSYPPAVHDAVEARHECIRELGEECEL